MLSAKYVRCNWSKMTWLSWYNVLTNLHEIEISLYCVLRTLLPTFSEALAKKMRVGLNLAIKKKKMKQNE